MTWECVACFDRTCSSSRRRPGPTTTFTERCAWERRLRPHPRTIYPRVPRSLVVGPGLRRDDGVGSWETSSRAVSTSARWVLGMKPRMTWLDAWSALAPPTPWPGLTGPSRVSGEVATASLDGRLGGRLWSGGNCSAQIKVFSVGLRMRCVIGACVNGI